MPPSRQLPKTFDDHHTVFYDSGQVQAAKSLLAAITLSDADLKDPIKTTQKLLVQDIVESIFKAIGTEESLKFVQLSTPPIQMLPTTRSLAYLVIKSIQSAIDKHCLVL